MKHTPGPWIRGGYLEEDVFDGEPCGEVWLENVNEETVCSLSYDSRLFINFEANAQLIAAAPDAVDLFRDLQEYLCEQGGEAVELLERVDSWLAKATGGDK